MGGGGGRFTGGGVGWLIISHDVVFRGGFGILLGGRVVILRGATEGAHGGEQGPTHDGGEEGKGESV